MTINNRPQSQFQLALAEFSKQRWAVVCFWVIVFIFSCTLLAGFIAPYSYSTETREHSYAPPTTIHFFPEGKFNPVVYNVTFSFNEYHQRIYLEDKTKSYPFKFLIKGDKYKLFWLIPSDVHLFGVEAPGHIYLWGADSRGRDEFSRLLYGAGISLSIGVIGVAISFVLGLLIGGIAGYKGGKTDAVLMRVAEMFMMVPGFYLMLALRSAVPDNFSSTQIYFSTVVILSFIGWAGLARIIRGMAISLKERDYVLAAKTMGKSDLSIIVHHILPHTFSYSIVAIMLSIPGYILGEAALSLIGLGIQDPIPSWGNMLSEAMAVAHLKLHPWILMPGVLIFIIVICFNVVGDALRDALDPLLKGTKT